MPSSLPTSRDVHVDTILSQMSIAYGQEDRAGFVADRAFTPVPVNKQSDKYNVWNKGDMFRSEADIRADGDISKGGGIRLSQSTYYAEVYALHTYITDRQRENAMNETDLEKAKVRWLTQQMLLKRDKIWAAAAFASGIWAGFTDQTGVSATPSTNQFLQWNDSSSTPIVDITEKMFAMEVASGVLPNIGVTNTKVMSYLKNHANFLDRIKHTQTGIVTENLIAQVLGLDEIIVGKATENTANEGASVSMSRVFGDRFLLLHRTPTPSNDSPTAGAMFSWTKFDGGQGTQIKQWYDNDREAQKYEAQAAFDAQVTATDLGGIFLSAVA